MEQGTRLDSTRMSAAQDVRDDTGPDHGLDAAVAALLTTPSAKAAAPEPDHELLRLGAEFDVAHAAWLDAVEANREPTERFTAFIDAAKARGGPTVKELEAAWALPGVTEANRRDDETFAAVTDLGLEIIKIPATSLAGLAVHARAVIPNVWVLGEYEEDAGLGDREDLPQKPVRALIQSALRLAGVDWKGRPQADAASVPAIQTSPSDLAAACVEQVRRLDYWGANPGAFSEKQGDEEMDRWGAVFRRAIDEPSAGSRDLAGKAYLMLADLNLFQPEDDGDYQTDNYRLMRVIMHEAIAMGGLVYVNSAAAGTGSQERCANADAGSQAMPAPPGDGIETRPSEPADEYTVLHAIQRHGDAKKALDAATLAADEVQIRNDGGDTSEAALEPLNTQWTTASNAYDQAYRDLIATRPLNLHGLLSLLRHLAQHADGHQGMEDEPDVFGALIGAVEGLRLSTIVPAAGYDLSRLSIAQLESLARIAGQERETLLAIENMAFCFDRKDSSYTPLGEIIETEGNRFAFLSDHAVNEIARRHPTTKDDINRRLETMVRHDLVCNGYIEPALMTEVVQAWGRA